MEEINKKLNLIDFYEKKYRDVKLYGESELNIFRKKYEGLQQYGKNIMGSEATIGINHKFQRVLYNDDNINNRIMFKLSSEITKMLTLSEGKMSICGSTVANAVYGRAIKEYNLYFHNIDHDEAEKLFQECMKCLNDYSGFHSKLVMKFITKNTVYNFHRTVYEDKSHIFLETDLDINQVGFNLIDKLFGSIHGISGLAFNTFPLRFHNHGPLFGYNLQKCLKDGFTANTLVDFHELHDEVSDFEVEPGTAPIDHDPDDTFDNIDGTFSFFDMSFKAKLRHIPQGKWSMNLILKFLARGWHDYIPFVGDNIESLSFEYIFGEMDNYYRRIMIDTLNLGPLTARKTINELKIFYGKDYKYCLDNYGDFEIFAKILHKRINLILDKLSKIFDLVKGEKWLTPKFKKSEMTDEIWYDILYDFHDPELFGIEDEEYLMISRLPLLKELKDNICKFRLRDLAYEAAVELF